MTNQRELHIMEQIVDIRRVMLKSKQYRDQIAQRALQSRLNMLHKAVNYNKERFENDLYEIVRRTGGQRWFNIGVGVNGTVPFIKAEISNY